MIIISVQLIGIDRFNEDNYDDIVGNDDDVWYSVDDYSVDDVSTCKIYYNRYLEKMFQK